MDINVGLLKYFHTNRFYCNFLSFVATRFFHAYLKTLNVILLSFKDTGTERVRHYRSRKFVPVSVRISFVEIKKLFFYEVREATTWRAGIWKIIYEW